MRSSAVTVGQAATAAQYDNLRNDAYASSFLLPHQQTVPGMTLYVENGVFYIGGTRVIFAGGNSPTISAPSSYPRIDLLVINSSGILSLVTGAENVSPSAPTYPKDKIVICEIYNVVGETVIYDNINQIAGQGYIYNDVREFLNNGKYISQTGVEIFAASDTGAANAYAISMNPVNTALTDGQIFSFRAANSNTGDSTLAIDGLTAYHIYKNIGGSFSTLTATDILAGQLVVVQWDATNTRFQMATPPAPTVLLTTKTLLSSRANNAASGVETIAHGLPRIPNFVEIHAMCSLAVNGSVWNNCVGTYDGTNTRSSSQAAFITGGGGVIGSTAQSTTNIIALSNGAGTQVATITVDATNIYLTWIKGSNGLFNTADSIVYSIRVQG